ncbi:MAG: hypothetical protein NUK65_01770 [Firmicutes bacterium]|nr:hypothetical protein [Bacillota bacterium]
MSTCSMCGSDVTPDDLYSIDGREVCEDCAPSYANPPRPCAGGPGGQLSA